MNHVITQRPEGISLAVACRTHGFNRSTGFARRRERLSEEERQRTRHVLCSKAYHDQPPDVIYCDLQELGEHIGSVLTLNRILAEDKTSEEYSI